MCLVYISKVLEEHRTTSISMAYFLLRAGWRNKTLVPFIDEKEKLNVPKYLQSKQFWLCQLAFIGKCHLSGAGRKTCLILTLQLYYKTDFSHL